VCWARARRRAGNLPETAELSTAGKLFRPQLPGDPGHAARSAGADGNVMIHLTVRALLHRLTAKDASVISPSACAARDSVIVDRYPLFSAGYYPR
jgi:hypothetical protein